MEAGVKQKLTLLEFFPEVKSKFNPTSHRYTYIRHEQAQVKIQNRPYRPVVFKVDRNYNLANKRGKLTGIRTKDITSKQATCLAD